MGQDGQVDGISNANSPITQRVITMIRHSGRNEQQVRALMGRTTLFGTLVNNVITCREPVLQAKCASHRERLEAELKAHRPTNGDVPWTDAETLDLIVAMTQSPVIPPILQSVFDRAIKVSDPA